LEIFKMSWRNLWRSRRRTLVTVSAMSLALLVMILYAGLMEGYFRDMERNVLDLEVGDVQIFAGDYRDNPSIYTRIESPESLLSPLREAGFRASARLLAFGLAAAGDSSAGVSFRGVDVEGYARVSLIHQQIAQGDWLDRRDPKGVVLGRRLARMLAVKPGSELVVLTQGADGAMAYDLYTVRGVLRGVGDATDRTGIFMTTDAFRELLGVTQGAHQIIVRRPDEIDLPAAARRVQHLAGDLDVQTWRQLLPTIASMMDSARGVMIAMFFVVYLAIAILILNAMLMAVFERIREIGVLKALGAGPFDVLRLVLLESALQTGLAILVGVALSIPSLLYLSHTGIDLGKLAGISILGIALDPVWRAEVNVDTFTRPILVLVLIVGIAVLYPALKAAWIRPVDAIHHH
jgi:ABC-type lipoprotein release transport system permease subunit